MLLYTFLEIDMFNRNGSLNKVCQRQVEIYRWFVILDLTALCDNITVYIGPSPRERKCLYLIILIFCFVMSNQNYFANLDLSLLVCLFCCCFTSTRLR